MGLSNRFREKLESHLEKKMRFELGDSVELEHKSGKFEVIDYQVHVSDGYVRYKLKSSETGTEAWIGEFQSVGTMTPWTGYGEESGDEDFEGPSNMRF